MRIVWYGTIHYLTTEDLNLPRPHPLHTHNILECFDARMPHSSPHACRPSQEFRILYFIRPELHLSGLFVNEFFFNQLDAAIGQKATIGKLLSIGQIHVLSLFMMMMMKNQKYVYSKNTILHINDSRTYFQKDTRRARSSGHRRAQSEL